MDFKDKFRVSGSELLALVNPRRKGLTRHRRLAIDMASVTSHAPKISLKFTFRFNLTWTITPEKLASLTKKIDSSSSTSSLVVDLLSLVEVLQLLLYCICISAIQRCTLCLKKSMWRYLFEHNSNINCPIIIIFGTVVTETTGYWIGVSFFHLTYFVHSTTTLEITQHGNLLIWP